MFEAKPSLVFLRGKKTNLRPLTRADVPLLTRWINDPDLREFLSATFPQTELREEEWFAKLGTDDKNVILGIETKDGQLIGTMGIHSINWRDRVCTTGALIGEKECWGKGYGTDAKMVLLEYIFDTLNLRKVCSDVIEYNERSLRYSLHCGYLREGLRKKHVFKNGRYWDLIQLALFREDWLPVWQRYQETGTVK